MRILNLLIFIIIIFCFLSLVDSKGDLTKQKPIEVKVFLKGEKNERYFFDPSELKFQTGKLYSLEWWFVPIKTGYFDDLVCDIIEKDVNLKHSQMGMTGVIIIE